MRCYQLKKPSPHRNTGATVPAGTFSSLMFPHSKVVSESGASDVRRGGREIFSQKLNEMFLQEHYSFLCLMTDSRAI
jgi:hypothetical protein